MKRKDWILIFIISAIALIFAIYIKAVGTPQGTEVIITVNREEFGRYSLDKDREIVIDGHNTLMIKDGKANMIQADCPDKLCVKQKPISRKGESIICLPNRVVVTIPGENEDIPDVVTG